ncbi:MAG: pyruvate formate-lyase-activating protein [Candidatus Omnitrophota bacterium]
MKKCELKNSLGRIHSFESFGTHEGPGIRYLVFMQGCIARCRYCQNPDTWDIAGGNLVSAPDTFAKIESCLPYIRSSGGGVTITGGEPFLQPAFLIELFTICKKNGIHTAIDTSAFAKVDAKILDKIIRLTDLFIIDIKAVTAAVHKKITGRRAGDPLLLIKRLEKAGKPYWIRYVLVPAVNDSEKEMTALRSILKPLRLCAKFEFLPYHTLGKHKWKALHLAYPLPNIKSASEQQLRKAYLQISTKLPTSIY